MCWEAGSRDRYKNKLGEYAKHMVKSVSGKESQEDGENRRGGTVSTVVGEALTEVAMGESAGRKDTGKESRVAGERRREVSCCGTESRLGGPCTPAGFWLLLRVRWVLLEGFDRGVL